MYLLMTGGTGLLGEYLIRDFLQRGVRLVVVARGSRSASAQERVDAICQRWWNQSRRSSAAPLCGIRPVVLNGDITQPDLALSDDDRRWLGKHCNAVLHNAASLTFDANRPDGEPWRSNLHGTENVVNLARSLAIPHFHHVSTAYVCGTRTGQILESELDSGQSFSNEYEASKCAAELLVRAAGFQQTTIYRPAIIVGDSETGYTSTYHGFYAPLKSMAVLLSTLQRSATGTAAPKVPVSMMMAALGLTGNERKHFVPVEWVSQCIVSLLQDPTAHGGTYHLTSAQPVTAAAAAEAMEQAFHEAAAVKADRSTSASPDTSPADSDGSIDWLQLGATFAQQLDSYQTYWRDDPDFDSRERDTKLPHLPSPVLDNRVLRRLCRYALSHNFGWPKQQPPRLANTLANWLQQRYPQTQTTASASQPQTIPALQLQSYGPGGGEFVLSRPAKANANTPQLFVEPGYIPELPRLIFHQLDLNTSDCLNGLLEDGRAVLQLEAQSSQVIRDGETEARIIAECRQLVEQIDLSIVAPALTEYV